MPIWLTDSRTAIFSLYRQCRYCEHVIEEVPKDLERAIAAVTARLPAGYPDAVATAIFAGLQRTAKLLADAAP